MQVMQSYGFLVFNNTVVDKNFFRKIKLVSSQYSENVRRIKLVYVKLSSYPTQIVVHLNAPCIDPTIDI